MTRTYAAALLLLLGVYAASASGAYEIADTKLDTSSMSFYGFYGFYGFTGAPAPLYCDVVEVKFTLYNYGAHDLTSINTIQYIIDQTKEAIALTFKEAAPTYSEDDYVATVTELDGSSVTFVTVTAEISFQDGAIDDISKARALGGQFAAACGITVDDNEAGTDTMHGPVPSTDGVCSLGFDIIVSGYQQDMLHNHNNEMVAFQTALQSSWQSAIYKSTGDDKAAAAATIELVGITDADADDIAVRLFLHFGEGKDTCKDFEGQILADSYSMSDNWGILAGRIRIVETTNETHNRRRSLLQAGAVGTGANAGLAEKNLLSINVAKAGMGVNSIEPGSAECKIIDGLVDSDSTGEASSDGATGTSDGPGTSDSANTGPNVSTELSGPAAAAAAASSAAAAASSAAASGTTAAGGTAAAAAGDSGSDSADYHSFYGFYGSSDDSSFYGIYGVSGSDAEASSAMGSSAGGGGGSSSGGNGGGGSSGGNGGGGSSEYSSAMGTSFYGYTDSAPSSPSSSTPSKPSTPSAPAPKPAAPSPVTPPAVATYPVYFTTFLSDYTMEDLSGAEDMAQFQSDYVAAVDNAIQLLGITSGPSISVDDVYAASVAVDTLVKFTDDAAGADLLMQVLAQNPSLAFPAFSSLGSVTITDVRTAPGSSDVTAQGQSTPGPSTCSQQGILDRNGECCLSPASLDAEMSCCFEQVDECGVCGGDGQSCALAAMVRVSTPATPALQDKSTPEFAQFVADFKDGLSTLFSSYGINPSNVEVDEAGILSTTDANGDLIADIGFKFYPAANGATVPTVSQAQGILANAATASMTHKDITLDEVLQVGRAGICGNGFCEVGEMLPTDQSSGHGLCAADCPGVLTSCPVGAENSPIGEKFETCSGNGGCALSTGMCNCDSGYSGVDCGACADGFTAANGVCHSAAGVVDGQTSKAADGSEGSNTTSIVLGVVFGVIALIVIALAVYWLLVLRKRRDASREEGLAFSSQAQVPAANEEPEVPSRQVVENTV